MEKIIEVEVRGGIENFDETLENFNKKAKFIKEKDRISFIYFRDGTDVNDRSTIREDPVDLKLRITDKKAEIVMKYGRWGAEEARKEFLFPLELDKFGLALEFFSYLDWYKGVIVDTKTFLFQLDNIEFALVKSGDICYFEAEKLISDEKEIKKTIEEIKGVCNELNLRVFDEKELIEIMETLNKRDSRIFNLREKSFEKIKKNFEEFF
jgi:adenylate cyclase class IV